MHKDLSEVINGINNKDYGAWEHLYKLYYKALCSYSNSIVKDFQCAEDIIQELLMKIWQSEIRFDSSRELVAYLYKSSYNNSIIWLRNNGIHTDILSTIHNERDIERRSEIENSEICEADFLVSVVGQEVIRELYQSIEELPMDRRQIILMSIQGLSGAEIAQKLGVSINTVKTQKYRSYKYLKQRLKHHFVLAPMLFGILNI